MTEKVQLLAWSKGTGLGLSQVYGFMKQSGGHVALYSEPGEGTTVKLYLPRYKGPDEAAFGDERQDEPGRSGNGETVVVVEDDEVVRRFTVNALRKAGYRILEAAERR